jgi:hypothetical protein
MATDPVLAKIELAVVALVVAVVVLSLVWLFAAEGRLALFRERGGRVAVVLCERRA